jgi:hypothetical protein
VSILSGNGQMAEPGHFNAQPFDLAVWDATGAQPLADVPVTFTVQSGGGQLAPANTLAAPLSSSLTLTTDADGTVQAYYRHADLPGVQSEIKATAGSREVIFQTATLGLAATASATASTGITGEQPSGSAATRGLAFKTSRTIGDALFAATRRNSNNEKSRAADTKTVKHADVATTGLHLVLKADTNQYVSVDTTTWTIASVSAP